MTNLRERRFPVYCSRPACGPCFRVPKPPTTMCGFAGIVTWDNRHRVHRDVLERMSARIAHRGPDGAGLWINHEQEATAERPQVGLVFRRLAIIDLDERANQPFTDGQG